MLMRHGIRPPTKAQPVPRKIRRRQMAELERRARPADRTRCRGRTSCSAHRTAHSSPQRGLFGAGCPTPGAVVLKASGKPRAIDTAKNWAAAFMPGCVGDVDHPTEDGPDPIFHGFDDQPAELRRREGARRGEGCAAQGWHRRGSARHRPQLHTARPGAGLRGAGLPVAHRTDRTGRRRRTTGRNWRGRSISARPPASRSCSNTSRGCR